MLNRTRGKIKPTFSTEYGPFRPFGKYIFDGRQERIVVIPS
jgi:hypothetical protein